MTITLPRKWTQEFGVKAGDEINVEEETDRLIIDSRQERRAKSITFNLESSNKTYVDSILGNLYNSDIENIELTYQDANTLPSIQEYSRRFLGWEFLEQNGKHCIIKNYATYNEENFNELYKKAFMNITNASEAIVDDLKRKKEVNLKKILHINDTTYRFANYCRKMLIRKAMFSVAQNRAHSHILTDLIIISTNFTSIADHIDNNKIKNVSRQTLGYFQKVIEYHQQMQAIFLQKNDKELPAFIDAGKELKNEGHVLLSKSKESDTITLHYLITIANLIRYQSGRLMIVSEKF